MEKVYPPGGRGGLEVSRRAVGEVEIDAPLDQPRPPPPTDRADHLPRLVERHAADHRDPPLDDARLLPGDGRQGVAQLPLVIEADAGDDRDQRAADVRGVQPAAQSHFQNGDVGLLAGEVEHRGRGEDLEKGRPDLVAAAAGRLGVHRLDRRLNFRQEGEKSVVRAGQAVDRDPLLDPLQVGQGEQSRAISGGGQHCGDGGGDRALALVPATWTAGRLRCGLPSRASNRLIRPSRISATP